MENGNESQSINRYRLTQKALAEELGKELDI